MSVNITQENGAMSIQGQTILAGDSSNKIATTEFVSRAVSDLSLNLNTKISGSGSGSGSGFDTNTTEIAIGKDAGLDQNENAIAIGNEAGNNNQKKNAIAIGDRAGRGVQSLNAIAIGSGAGNLEQSQNSIAIGLNSGNFSQGENTIAIGNSAGGNRQGNYSIAIGTNAGDNKLGENSIAIGKSAAAGDQSNKTNCILINASVNGLTSEHSNSCKIAPIRANPAPSDETHLLYYDRATNEIISKSIWIRPIVNYNVWNNEYNKISDNYLSAGKYMFSASICISFSSPPSSIDLVSFIINNKQFYNTSSNNEDNMYEYLDNSTLTISGTTKKVYSFCGSFTNPTDGPVKLFAKITTTGGAISGINTVNGLSSFTLFSIA